jgi:hypothetical protein
MPTDIANITDTVRAAQLAADATRDAAHIAGHHAIWSAGITAAGTVIGLLGTVITAYVLYRNVQKPLEIAQKEKEIEKSVLLSHLRISTKETITLVDVVIQKYTTFDLPVELAVLSPPNAIAQYTRKELVPLGPSINEAISVINFCLDDYRRAKAPIQDRLRERGDDRPVMLHERPPDFSDVLTAAKTYRGSLDKLEGLIGAQRST